MLRLRVSNTVSRSCIAAFDFGPGMAVRIIGDVGSSGKYDLLLEELRLEP